MSAEDNLRRALRDSKRAGLLLGEIEGDAMPLQDRNLTDADVDAIVKRFQESFTKQFYADFGKGVWKLVLHGLLAAAIALAAWGHFGGGAK